MTWLADSLWDLLRMGPRPRRQRSKPVIAKSKPSAGPEVQPDVARSSSANGRESMQQRYDSIVVEMKLTYSVKVRKWRKSSSGVAYELRYRNGAVSKLIESPYPRGPVSCAIFLHEIGHHAIGLGVHRPRCLEEYHVWMWALDMMRQRGFNVTPAVEKRVHDSMKYAVAKARRRGMKSVPEQLKAYA
jgi:hypothetical protein